MTFLCKTSSPQAKILTLEVKSALKYFLFHWCIYLDTSYSTQWTHIVSLCILCWVLFSSWDTFTWFWWSQPQCCGCAFKQKKKVGVGDIFGYLSIFVIILSFFFSFCHFYCVFFKCNIPKIFVFTSGSIVFFLFSLLLLLMFYKKTKLVCTFEKQKLSLKCSVIWTWQLFERSKAGEMWFAEILLDTTHFWCLSFREVGQQIVLVDEICG